MPYCFMKFRPAKGGVGQEADCPDHLKYVLLADAGEADWGLFDYSQSEGSEGWTPFRAAGEALCATIQSGNRYPPALALARQETAELFQGHRPSVDQFEKAYAVAVRHHLSKQHEARYVLAMALRDEAENLSKGEWYWILGVRGSKVSWVTDDFCVEYNPIGDFDLTDTQLKYLS